MFTTQISGLNVAKYTGISNAMLLTSGMNKFLPFVSALQKYRLIHFDLLNCERAYAFGIKINLYEANLYHSNFYKFGTYLKCVNYSNAP